MRDFYFAAFMSASLLVLASSATAQPASTAPSAATATATPTTTAATTSASVEDSVQASLNRIVCRNSPPPVGSRIGGARVCKTQREWNRMRQEGQDQLNRLQIQRGCTQASC